MYIIMQRDLKSGQSMTIAGIASKTWGGAQIEFTEWIRNRIIEDEEGEYRKMPYPGIYDHQNRALLLDGELTDKFIYDGDLFFIQETEDETENN
jgi:hypothetical protein